MNEIVITSNGSDATENLIALLNILFPDCKIKVFTERVERTEKISNRGGCDVEFSDNE